MKLLNFKKKFLSKESNIEKIYSRNNERVALDPEININIGIYDNEENISTKVHIHRARLSKFKRSKLNGELIYMDSNEKIFKYVEGEKFFLS